MTPEQQKTTDNIHTVYTLCNECHSWGVNKPDNRQCGNCNSLDTIIYYDEQTVEAYAQEREEKAFDLGWNGGYDTALNHGNNDEEQDRNYKLFKNKLNS